jgi:hypothetical protein
MDGALSPLADIVAIIFYTTLQNQDRKWGMWVNKLLGLLKTWPWTQILLALILAMSVTNYFGTRKLQSDLNHIKTDLQILRIQLSSLP